jgi:hypothetical protein
LKVLLIGNYATDQQRSMLGFAGALETGLRAREVDVRKLAPKPVLGNLRFPSAIRKWLGYVDKFAFFPRELRKARDVG